MAKMGRDTRLKRAAAPKFWRIPRKAKKFTVSPSPGPHPKNQCYPLAILVRDGLKLTHTYREARAAITEGSLLLDGVARREASFPVGLMDVIDVPVLGKTYRLLPSPKSMLAPVEIPESEQSLKLCRIRSKTTVRKGKIQYGLHDGRSLLTEAEVSLNVGDSVLIDLPSQRIRQTFSLEEGAQALVLRGAKVGRIGTIEELKEGTFSSPRRAVLNIGGARTELPTELLLVVGKGKPPLSLPIEEASA